ncbi:DNA methyltransferase [Nitrosomonas supralitoralis]|uniref:DNA methyltransferase n=1 Tax=Nitrosomonas supralitoralis TaxID=2116706 RepID=UPI0035A8E0C0
MKRIYIDPTYNTGQNDRGVDAQQTGWIFNNRVEGPEILDWLGKIVDIEAKDLCRHDNWLCMMCSRLRLLKDFLLDDDVTDRIGAIVQRLIQEGRIIFGENETKPVELKIYAKDYRVKLSRFFERGGRIGANEIQAIFPENKRPFGFPKSTELIEELLSFTTGDGGMTLDSFSGSGTTTNTALKQNRADRQTRRFILIEMKDAGGKAYQQALSDDDAASCGTVTDQYTFEFHAPANAPIRDYNGRSEHFDFRKYFCGRIGDFASKAEFECTCHLEMWAQQECIKFWMSNLVQREHNLFFLQKAEGRLYPDFLCLLSGAETQSESTFTVEYKGANCWNGAEDDRLINGLRASLSEERCRFVIVKNKRWNWAEPLLT